MENGALNTSKKFFPEMRERALRPRRLSAALRATARDAYVRQPVFFRNEATAIAAGWRPCTVCMPAQYAFWKAEQLKTKTDRSETSLP